MKNNNISLKKGITFLLVSVLTVACVKIEPTAYLWQSFVSQETSAHQRHFDSATDDTGNTYHAFEEGGENFIRKVSAAGDELWRAPIAHNASYLAVTQNGIVGISKLALRPEGLATMITTDGSELWSKTLVEPQSSLKLVSSTSQDITVAYNEYNAASKSLIYSSFDLDGTERWRYSYDTNNYLHDYYPPFKLSNGNILLLLPVGLDKSSPDYHPAASSLTSVLLDNNGTELARHDFGVMTYNNFPSYFMKNDQVYFTRRQGDNTILSRLSTEGTIDWSYIANGYLNCSTPSEDRIACIKTKYIAPLHNRYNSLLFVGLEGTLISSTALPYQATNVNDSTETLFNGNESNILYNGNDKWITKEYVGPSSVINAIDALISKDFYYKYHVINQYGVETSTIVTEPGKVRFNASIYGDFSIPVVTKETDIPNHASAASDTLFVTGWNGSFGSGNGFVRAYALK